jgi:hypothetical protein
MVFLYKIGAAQVGDRSGHPSHPIRSSPGENPRLDTPVKELTGPTLKWLAVEISSEHVPVDDPALQLGVTCRHHATANLDGGLAGWAQQRVRLR